MPAPIRLESDKFYWHRYQDIYESALARVPAPTNIVEFGVLHGASISWLAQAYPESRVVGVDILPPAPGWPKGDHILYMQCDQGDRAQLLRTLSEIASPIHLLIEDGSHQPQHQWNTLSLASSFMARGGVYILEDLHTSARVALKKPRLRGAGWIERRVFGDHGRGSPSANCYNLLLAMERARELQRHLTSDEIASLAHRSFMGPDDISAIDRQVADVVLYRRPGLPIRCFACNGADFDVQALKCACGQKLVDGIDSITAILLFDEA